MRFILAMVRILGILLSIALFCIFIYFAFIDKSNTNNSKFLSYGSLLLFVFSTIITSLISVGFENYQNKRQSSDVLSDINNRLKLFNNWQSASPAPVPEVNVQAIIDKLSADSAKTAQLLDSGVEKINRQIYQLRDSDTAKTINFGLENINNRLTEIQESSIASAKSAITPLTDLTKLYDDFSALINDFKQHNNPTIEKIMHNMQEVTDKQAETINKLNDLCSLLKASKNNTITDNVADIATNIIEQQLTSGSVDISLDTVTSDKEISLADNHTVNDKLAAELAELDILKDNNANTDTPDDDNIAEIDISSLFENKEERNI